MITVNASCDSDNSRGNLVISFRYGRRGLCVYTCRSIARHSLSGVWIVGLGMLKVVGRHSERPCAGGISRRRARELPTPGPVDT